MSNKYIAGDLAVDLSRITGIGLCSVRHRFNEPGDISPLAIDASGMPKDDFYIDCTRLDIWDRLRLLWAEIGGRVFLRGAEC